MVETYKSWIGYWNKQGSSREKDLRIMSGYSHSLAMISDKSLQRLLDYVVEKLHITESDKLLDVGCGAGVITTPLSGYVGAIVGLDASPSMIRHIPPVIKTYVGDASKMPFRDSSFDKLLCHSIFQYFESAEFARKVVMEMHRICRKGGRILIVDVPDKEKKQAYLGTKEPNRHNLKRIFYHKDFFRGMFPKTEVFDHELEGYGNAKYRFNVLIRK